MPNDVYSNLRQGMMAMKEEQRTRIPELKAEAYQIQAQAKQFMDDKHAENAELKAEANQIKANAHRFMHDQHTENAELKAEANQIKANAHRFMDNTHAENAEIKGQARQIKTQARRFMNDMRAENAGLKAEVSRTLGEYAQASRERANAWNQTLDAVASVHGRPARGRHRARRSGAPAHRHDKYAKNAELDDQTGADE